MRVARISITKTQAPVIKTKKGIVTLLIKVEREEFICRGAGIRTRIKSSQTIRAAVTLHPV